MITDMGGGTVDMTIHKVESVMGQEMALTEVTHRECLPEVRGLRKLTPNAICVTTSSEYTQHTVGLKSLQASQISDWAIDWPNRLDGRIVADCWPLPPSLHQL